MSTTNELRLLCKDTIRLFGLAWQTKSRLLLMAGAAVLCAAVAPFVQNFAIGRLLNELVLSQAAGGLTAPAQFFLLLGIVAGSGFAISNLLQFFFKTVLYKELFQYLSVLIHKNIAELDIRTHEDPQKKDLITKVQENAMWRAPDFMQRMAYICQNLLEVIFALMILITASWVFGALLLLASLPRLWVDIRYNHNLWQIETEVAETRRKFWYARWFLIDLRALTEVKLFQNVAYFVGLVNGHLDRIRQREVGAERRNLGYQFGALLCSELVTITLVVIFVLRTASGKLDIGTLAFYLSSLAAFRLSLNSLSQNIGSQFRDGKFVRDMFEAFELKPAAVPAAQTVLKVPERIEQIAFDHVSFIYPRTEREVLSDVNLVIHGGETLGIVAENGNGKSTLAKLLCRIYEPTSGRILVNGRDLREFDLEEWRSRVGVMLQEYLHYEHLDIRSAIRLGRSNNGSSELEIEQAAEFGEARAFIDALPHGFDTTLGRFFERGVELSGGQYQMLAIARLGYRKPELAIFDEPTSAIDGAKESRIFERILRGLPGTTKILISHRFYTLRKADRICLLRDGKVHEYGSHAELMKLDGVYAERYRSQADEYL